MPASDRQATHPQEGANPCDARVQEAREAFESALFGYADSDVTLRLGRAYGAAQEACETLDQRAGRLERMADDKDAEEARHMAAEAAAAGLAATRRAKGNDDAMAASYDREAASCLSLAQDCAAEAERLRSQADALWRAIDLNNTIHAITRAA